MTKNLLDDLTEEEYFILREMHGVEGLAKALDVSVSTVEKWKQKQKIHIKRVGNRKPRMSDQERLDLYLKLKDVESSRKIADKLEFATANSMGNWIRKMRKEGRI